MSSLFSVLGFLFVCLMFITIRSLFCDVCPGSDLIAFLHLAFLRDSEIVLQ